MTSRPRGTLDVLAANRNQILLAELAGMLHNLGKLHSDFVLAHAEDKAQQVTGGSAFSFEDERVDDPGTIIALAVANNEIRTRRGRPLASALLGGVFWDGASGVAGELLTLFSQSKRSSDAARNIGNELYDLAGRTSSPSDAEDIGAKTKAAVQLAHLLYGPAGLDQHLEPSFKQFLRGHHAELVGQRYSLSEMLLLFRDIFHFQPRLGSAYERRDAIGHWIGKGTDILRILAAAHQSMSQGEKQGASGEKARGRPQPFRDTRAATAFGYEAMALTSKQLDDARMGVQDAVRNGAVLTNRSLVLDLATYLSCGLGDTQRPINDVTLWDYASAIAALYKSAVAQSVLQGAWADTRTIQWRLLAIRCNGLTYLAQAHHITDILGRREVLNRALDAVQKLLERQYPLGNEVYRDENGSVFIVPDVPDLLEWTASDNGATQTLQELVARSVDRQGEAEALDGEVTITAELSQPYEGHRIALGAVLRQPCPPLSARPAAVVKWWQGVNQAEVCTVCRVRPQGGMAPTDALRRKATGRNVCYVCLQRRGERSRNWAGNLDGPTVWLDEVADADGRAALVVGRFDLDDWLTGDFVQTMAAGIDPQSNTPVSKNPSFARLRRVWETTQRFWQDSADGISDAIGRAGVRLRIQPDEGFRREDVGPYHAYELPVGGRSLPVVWTGNHFLSAINLCSFARLLGAPDEVWRDEQAAARFVELGIPTPLAVRESGGYGMQSREVSRVPYATVEILTEPYIPAIPILAEPRTFMVLVPAARALVLAERIADRYDEQMGKVRDRLALHVGIVYFNRRTPLGPVLDAGRRMLAMPSVKESWEVKAADHGDATSALSFTNGLQWKVPVVMGDGKTRDDWYPHLFVDQLAPEARVGPPRFLTVSRPDGGSSKLIHARDLQIGDRVNVRPSRFDYEFLDTTGRRFDVSYDQAGHRRPLYRFQRPYYLEELPTMQRLYAQLPRSDSGELATTQVRQLVQLIEAKREEWGEGRGRQVSADGPFRRLVSDALAQAGTDWWVRLDRRSREEFERAALSGALADVLELNEILTRADA